MPKAVPKQTIILSRPRGFPNSVKDAPMEHYSPPIDTPFEFTAEELAQIKASNPSAISNDAVVDVSKETDVERAARVKSETENAARAKIEADNKAAAKLAAGGKPGGDL